MSRLPQTRFAETKAAYAELRARSKTRPTGYWFSLQFRFGAGRAGG